jgi:hypothetical protein
VAACYELAQPGETGAALSLLRFLRPLQEYGGSW